MSQQPVPAEQYRREALGALAHDIRTPLTSMRMVMELAKSGATGDAMALDEELAGMLRTSVDELIKIADDLQEMSWLERGKIAIGRGPSNLRSAFDEAAARLQGRVTLAGVQSPSIEGPWDEIRLVGVIEGAAFAANRCGDGLGRLECRFDERPGEVCVVFASGELNGEPRPVDSDLGFRFFRALAVATAMGGRIEVNRADRSSVVLLHLPR